MSRFYLVRGTDRTGSERLPIEREVIAGRGRDCDLRIREGYPSRRHARLWVENDVLWVQDLESKNGTFVNRLRASPSRKEQLHDGDFVCFDSATFLVTTSGERAERQEQSALLATLTQFVRPKKDGAWARLSFFMPGTVWISEQERRKYLEQRATVPMDPPLRPCIRVLNGNSSGMVLDLDPSCTAWTIGRDPGHDLRLDYEGVSTFHAKLTYDRRHWCLRDQLSTNGTFVNEQRVTIRYLRDGDYMQFGGAECLFRLPPPPAPGRAGIRRFIPEFRFWRRAG